MSVSAWSATSFLLHPSRLFNTHFQVNLTLIDLPLWVILRAMPRRSLRRFARQLFKTVLATLAFVRTRKFAQSIGLHQNAGNIQVYAAPIFKSVRRLQLRLAAASETWKLPRSYLYTAVVPPSTPMKRINESQLEYNAAAGVVTPSQWSTD